MMQNKELLADIRKGDRKKGTNRFELLYGLHERNLSKLECKGGNLYNNYIVVRRQNERQIKSARSPKSSTKSPNRTISQPGYQVFEELYLDSFRKKAKLEKMRD